MERKEMLLKAEAPERPTPPVSEQKLSEKVEEAACYLQMIDGRGWQMLVRKFINPRSALSRILAQPGGRSRDEATAAVAELVELLQHIDGVIKEGRNANEQLEALKKQRRK